jgi:hypothetical protein
MLHTPPSLKTSLKGAALLRSYRCTSFIGLEFREGSNVFEEEKFSRRSESIEALEGED